MRIPMTKIAAAMILFFSAANAGANPVTVAGKAAPGKPAVSPKTPVQDPPMWDAKEEGWGSWNELYFKDENGADRSGWTRSLGYAKKWPWSNYERIPGETPVFILKQTGRRKKNLPDGHVAEISLFESTETPYVVKVSKEGDRVTRKGTNLSSVPNYRQHMTAQGSTMLVFPPKKTAAEKPKEEPKNEQPKNEQPKKEQPKNEQPKKEEPKKEQPKKEEPKKEEPKKEEPKRDITPVEKVESLTGFETAVIAGLTLKEIDEFKADQKKATAEPKEEGAIIKKWRQKVVETVKSYNIGGAKPLNPTAKDVWERLDPREKGYLMERLNQIGGDAMASVNKQAAEANKALVKNDAKASDKFIGTFRHLIKKDFELYMQQSNGTIVDPRKQLEYAGEAIKACDGVANLEECTARMDDVYAGKKTAPKAPVETGGDKKDDKKKDDKKIATPDSKPATKDKKEKVVPPTPAKDPGLGADKPEEPKKEEGHNWKKWATEGGISGALIGGILGLLMGGPWGWGLLGGIAIGAGLGFVGGYLIKWFHG